MRTPWVIPGGVARPQDLQFDRLSDPVGFEVVGELRHHLGLATLTGKQQAHRVQIVKQTTAAAQGEPID